MRLDELVGSWKIKEIAERQNNEYVVVYESGIEKKSWGKIVKCVLPLRHNGGHYKANGEHH